MADKRMFSCAVIQSDNFLDLPPESQAAYFHLSMMADDDGIIDSPRRAMRLTGLSTESIQPLIDSGFILQFDDGTLVIVDWKRNNYLQNDRYHPSTRQDIMKQLKTDESRRYYRTNKSCIQAVSNVDTSCIQNGSSVKYSIEENKVSIEKIREKEREQSEDQKGVSPTGNKNDYVPQYWELPLNTKFWGVFASEDDYWRYIEQHPEEIEQ